MHRAFFGTVPAVPRHEPPRRRAPPPAGPVGKTAVKPHGALFRALSLPSPIRDTGFGCVGVSLPPIKHVVAAATRRLHADSRGGGALQSVLQQGSASTPATSASSCAKTSSAPASTRTGVSKGALHSALAQSLPSSTAPTPQSKDRSTAPAGVAQKSQSSMPAGNPRVGVLGVFSNVFQSTASAASTSTCPGSSSASNRASSASARSSARPAPSAVVKTAGQRRAARRAVAACHGKKSSVPLADLVGGAAETYQEHRARHPQFEPGCSRCVYYALRSPWERGFGCHRHQQSGGNEVRTVWVASRPGTLGGVWGLGCLFCAAYHARRAEAARANPGIKVNRKPGTMGSRRSWANFEVRSLSMMASRALRHHADTMTHRLAAQAYFLPDRSNTLTLIEPTNLDRLSMFFIWVLCVFQPSLSFWGVDI